jgi:hypothetical protein
LKKNQKWRTAAEFAFDLIVGAAVTVIIYGVAVGLELAVHRLEGLGVSHYTILLLAGLHYIVETLDVVAFIAYSIAVGIDAIREFYA